MTSLACRLSLKTVYRPRLLSTSRLIPVTLAMRQASRYLLQDRVSSVRLSSEFMPELATNIARPRFQPRRSERTICTVLTSAVLPGSTQLRTGTPSRVTARATSTCGAQNP